jgi:hypothetical protein
MAAARRCAWSRPALWKYIADSLNSSCGLRFDCMREVSEAHLHEIKEAVTKWTDLATKVGN